MPDGGIVQGAARNCYHPLLALLRPSNIDVATGALKHLARIVAQIRQVWPDVHTLQVYHSNELSSPMMESNCKNCGSGTNNSM
jgi:hypothetical protein